MYVAHQLYCTLADYSKTQLCMLAIPHHQLQVLFGQIAAGDEGAFEQVYRALAPTIFTTVMLYAKEEDLSREIVQTTFVKLWEKRNAMANVSSPQDYLFIVARNLLFDHLKKMARDKKMFQIFKDLHKESIDDTSNRVENQQYEQLLETAISKLPQQQRQVYIYSKKEGLDYDEIAELMQLSRHTVRKHLELANHFIREYIKAHILSILAGGFFFNGHDLFS